MHILWYSCFAMADMGRAMRVDRSLPDDQYWNQAYQRYLKRYLRCVKGVDDNIRRILDYLEKEGLLENTIIFYTGDQGMFLGEHDFIDKRWMYEEALRMPLIVRYPRAFEPGSRTAWLINNTDFAPTMLEMAGMDTPSYMQGRSFVQALRGETKPDDWRKAHYYRYWMHMAHNHNNPAHFGIRTEQYKLIFFYGTDYIKSDREDNDGNRFRGDTPVAWELYDLKNDFNETTNIYEQMKDSCIVKELKALLAETRHELGDTDDEYPHIKSIVEAHWND